MSDSIPTITINVAELYAADETALLANLPEYERKVVELLPSDTVVDVCLTGGGPIWLYLRIAHALHGLVRVLSYSSPAAGNVIIFNHTS